MSKRRRASELIFKRSHCLKYPVAVVPILAGTGTVATHGIISVYASVATTNVAYLTVSSGTNIATLIGTAIGA